MAINQIMQGCGAWSVGWKHRLPTSLRAAIGDGAHLVVFESDIEGGTSEILESFRSNALYEGVMTQISTTGCSGFEMSWSLGQPSGAGPRANGSQQFNFNDAMETRFDGVNGVDFDVSNVTFNGLYQGIWGPATGPGTVLGPSISARSRADEACSTATEYRRRFGLGEFVSWKMYPGFRMRADFSTALFNNDAVVLSDLDTEGYGEGGLLNVPCNLNVARGIDNVLSDSVVYGDRNASTGVTPIEFQSQTVPFNAHDGSAYESLVVIDGGGAQNELQATAARKGDQGLLPRVTVDVQPKRNPWLKEIDPGDRVYVHSAFEPDLFDVSNQVSHFGAIAPAQAYVQSVTRNIAPGMSVWLRNPQTGGVVEWNEVTEYVQTSTTPASLKLSSYLINPQADNFASNGSIRLGSDLAVARRLRRSSN